MLYGKSVQVSRRLCVMGLTREQPSKDPLKFSRAGNAARSRGLYDVAADAFALAAQYERRTTQRLLYIDAALRDVYRAGADLTPLAAELVVLRSQTERAGAGPFEDCRYNSRLPAKVALDFRIEEQAKQAERAIEENKYDLAFRMYADLARLAHQKLDNPFLWEEFAKRAIDANVRKCRASEDINNFANAIRVYEETIGYARKMGLQDGITALRSMAAGVYFRAGQFTELQGNMAEAAKWYVSGAGYAMRTMLTQEAELSDAAVRAYHAIAKNAIAAQHFEEAIETYKHAAAYADCAGAQNVGERMSHAVIDTYKDLAMYRASTGHDNLSAAAACLDGAQYADDVGISDRAASMRKLASKFAGT